jgi:hypothetical protein
VLPSLWRVVGVGEHGYGQPGSDRGKAGYATFHSASSTSRTLYAWATTVLSSLLIDDSGPWIPRRWQKLARQSFDGPSTPAESSQYRWGALCLTEAGRCRLKYDSQTSDMGYGGTRAIRELMIAFVDMLLMLS